MTKPEMIYLKCVAVAKGPKNDPIWQKAKVHVSCFHVTFAHWTVYLGLRTFLTVEKIVMSLTRHRQGRRIPVIPSFGFYIWKT